MTNCENLNIKELIEKAEEYDAIKQRLNDLETSIKQEKKNFVEFFRQYDIGFGERHEFTTALQYFNILMDKDERASYLNEQIKRNREEHLGRLELVDQEMECREDELMTAWDKLRDLRSAKYRRVINEINEEAKNDN